MAKTKFHVEPADADYQPTKEEQEKPIDFSHLDGLTVEDMARILTQPVAASKFRRAGRGRRRI